MSKIAIVWLRRNLRLDDNKSFAAALRYADKVLPIFIYDSTVLKRFQDPNDRRLSFITRTIYLMNEELRQHKGKILVLHGSPLDIIPKLVTQLNVKEIYADEDYEPSTIERDARVQKALADNCRLNLFCDHLLIKPDLISSKGGNQRPFKVYTPYMRAFRDFIESQGKLDNNKLLTEYKYKLEGKLFMPPSEIKDCKSIELSLGEEEVLKQVGYVYKKDDLWDPQLAHHTLKEFIELKINNYKADRDLLYPSTTSRISPYLRFGQISVRKCFREAFALEANQGVNHWVNELIWREFFAYILYHFPKTVHKEFLESCRNTIPWNTNEQDYEKFVNAQTGYPLVDASIKQLKSDGWLHNRSRMVLASFLTKNLMIDWRKGEELFAQYLMDYEQSSNVGGWQWASSVGTDPQAYVRIFNPYVQGQKFDPTGEYVKTHIPSLRDVSGELIHSQKFHEKYKDYYRPIVNFDATRKQAERIFRDLLR